MEDIINLEDLFKPHEERAAKIELQKINAKKVKNRNRRFKQKNQKRKKRGQQKIVKGDAITLEVTGRYENEYFQTTEYRVNATQFANLYTIEQCFMNAIRKLGLHDNDKIQIIVSSPNLTNHISTRLVYVSEIENEIDNKIIRTVEYKHVNINELSVTIKVIR